MLGIEIRHLVDAPQRSDGSTEVPQLLRLTSKVHIFVRANSCACTLMCVFVRKEVLHARPVPFDANLLPRMRAVVHVYKCLTKNPDMSPGLIKSPRHSLHCMRGERRTERCVESLRDEADLRDQVHRTQRAAEDQLWTLEDQERKVHCRLNNRCLCVSRLQ